MLSWFWRSLIVIAASSWFSILLYLHWWCTVKHKSSSRTVFIYIELIHGNTHIIRIMWAVKVRLLKLNVFESKVLIILLSAIPRLTAGFRSWRKQQFCKTEICTKKALRQIGFKVSAVDVNAHESLNNVSSPRPYTNKTGNVLQRNTGGAFMQPLLQREIISITYPECMLVAFFFFSVEMYLSQCGLLHLPCFRRSNFHFHQLL
jgi:hypothetical protein